MLHIKIMMNPAKKAHRDLLFVCFPLRFFSICDSYYFQLTSEFENKTKSTKETNERVLQKLIGESVSQLSDTIKQLEIGTAAFFAFELYDEYQSGILFENLNNSNIKLSYVLTMNGGYEVQRLSQVIKIVSKKDITNYKLMGSQIRLPKLEILKYLSKTAKNIQLVNDFDFLSSWKS